MSLLASCAILAGVLAPLAALMGWWAHSHYGLIGVAAAAIAGGICWLSASLALTAAYLGQQFGNPIAGILGGMFFRLGLPLATGIAINAQVSSLAAAGCFGMIMGLYFVALVAETILSLKFVPQSQKKSLGNLSTPAGTA